MVEERVAALTRLATEYSELGRLWDSLESSDEQELRELFYCCFIIDLAELVEAFRRPRAITAKRADKYLRELITPIASQKRIHAGAVRAITELNYPSLT